MDQTDYSLVPRLFSLMLSDTDSDVTSTETS